MEAILYFSSKCLYLQNFTIWGLQYNVLKCYFIKTLLFYQHFFEPWVQFEN
jgi:hypothetical protein